MVKKELITLKLTEIIPYERNPRYNDEAVADVKESIRQCENLDPIEVDEDNIILSGHTRLKAMQEMGIEETDVIRHHGLSDVQKKKYRLLANKTAEKSKWNFDLLADELDGLDFDDFDFGFNVDFSVGDGEQNLDPGGEIGAEQFSDSEFNCKCPKCGFMFNVEGKGNV